jgi:Ca-activated chloride channel family protein
MTFASPYWFLCLAFLPLWWWLGKKRGPSFFSMPIFEHFGIGGWRIRARSRLEPLRILTLLFMVMALSRPQWRWLEDKVIADAMDIILAMDISPSMLSKDLKPDRLSVAKQVARDFVGNRRFDRIGLVLFSAEAFTQCPLTTQTTLLQSFIEAVEVGRLEDGTAIGMGLAVAINRLKDSPSKTRIIILLSDGAHNDGYLSPAQAANMAAKWGIRVYTVGIGTTGMVETPAQRAPDGSYFFGWQKMVFKGTLLEEVARITGGRFYRAHSENDLKDIYMDIDRLEKTPLEIRKILHLKELYVFPLGLALIGMLLELLLKYIFIRSLTT